MRRIKLASSPPQHWFFWPSTQRRFLTTTIPDSEHTGLKKKKTPDFEVTFESHPEADTRFSKSKAAGTGPSTVKKLSEMGDYKVSSLHLSGPVIRLEKFADSVVGLVQNAKSVKSASVMPYFWTPHAIRVLQALAEKPSLDHLSITLDPDNGIASTKEVLRVLCSFPPFKESLNISNSGKEIVWDFLFQNGRQSFLGQPSTRTPKLVLHTKRWNTPMSPFGYNNFRVLSPLLSGDYLVKQETPGSNETLIIYSYPDKKL